MTYDNGTVAFVQNRVDESCRSLLAKMSANRSVSIVEYLVIGGIDVPCGMPRRVKFYIRVGSSYGIILEAAVAIVLNRPNALLARFHQELEKYDIKVTHDIQ